MDPILGTILLFPFNFAPENWLKCEGQEMKIADYQALYSLIGNNYGGNYPTNFKLPDLKGKAPVPGTSWCICVSNGIYPPRP
ncbi:MAG: phage tail protein [Bacteroidota bacterium]